jgi:hypothetical protein
MSDVMSQKDLQRTFVVMLFAFAVSVVAQQFAELLIVVTDNWHSDLIPLNSINGKGLELTALATHLLLSLLMLTISWVMWSKSKAAGHLEDIDRIFSAKYIVFLVEILLVTLYLSIAKTMEGDFSAYQSHKTIESYVQQISAKPEAMQMCWVFLIFIIWDYFVDVLRSPQDPIAKFGLPWFKSQVTGILTYCMVSIVCLFFTYVIYKLSSPAGSAMQAIAADLGLIIVLLLFYQCKYVENYLFLVFPKERSRANSKREPTNSAIAWSLFLLVFYAFCVGYLI